MKLQLLALSATFFLAVPAFSQTPLSTDRVELGANGDRTIIRSSTWPDFDGGSVQVDQRLNPDSLGRLVYRYEQQNEATKLYHQAFCANMDMEPSKGEGVIRGPATGWACTHEVQEGRTQPQSDLKNTDWVSATAPAGRVPVGASYFSSGRMAATSSVAGARSATVGVDNGRCSFTDTRHYGAPFSLSEGIGVSCIVHESRFLNTSLDVCIPKQCTSNRGTQFAE